MLTGGPGRDVFAFYARDSGRALDNGSDTITDFDGAEDVILLHGFGGQEISMRPVGAGTAIEAPGLLRIMLPGVPEVGADDLSFR